MTIEDAFPDHDSINDFLEELQTESDRGAAILGPVILDSALKKLLDAYLVGGGKRMWRGWTPFALRIGVAYSVGLISDFEYRDLETINKIRRRFAHQPHGLEFETESVRELCQNLRSPAAIEGEIPEGDPAEVWFLTARGRYAFSVAALENELRRRLARVTPLDEPELLAGSLKRGVERRGDR